MDPKCRVIEKPNDKADIGFVIYYPFQFYVYKNVYEELASRAEFIIDLSHPFSQKQHDALLRDIVTLLDKHNAPYRILYRSEFIYKRFLRNFFEKYNCLVSVWERGCMALPETAHIKKVCTTYGAGKELTMVRPSRGLYDVILAYGERDAQILSLLTKVEIVGNPKFDDWFNGKIDSEMLAAIKKRIDPHKKTILYLPTHGDLSSVDRLSASLKKVGSEYNVIVKLHYYMTREEPERVRALTDEHIVLFDDAIDLLPLLAVTDIVISDNSSAIFDAILADKPVVVADFWDKEFLNEEHKEIRHNARGIQGGLTYSESIEQLIKRDGLVLTVKDEKNISSVIEEAFADGEFYKKKREELRNTLFAFNDGACARRAAEAILKCIAEKGTPEKPIMYHAFEAYKRRVNDLSYMQEKMFHDKIADLEQVVHTRMLANASRFSIATILFHMSQQTEAVFQQSLGSLIEQDFPEQLRSIYIITRNPEVVYRNIDILSKRYKSAVQINVLDIAQDTNTLGIIVQGVLNQVQAEAIAFCDADYVYQSDWCSLLALEYAKDVRIGGVGGYRIALDDAVSKYDQYFYYELGKKLLIDTEQSYLQYVYPVTNKVYGQNPAGEYGTMSYRKKFLATIPEYVNNLTQLSIFQMGFTVKNTPIAFIPTPVRSLSKMTRKAFVQRLYATGLYESLLGLCEKKYFTSGKTVLGSITDGVRVLRTKKSFSQATVVILGHLSYWRGNKRGFVIRVVSRVFSFTKDLEKSIVR